VAGPADRRRRGAVAAALALASTALASCGGGGDTTIINQPGGTNSTNAQDLNVGGLSTTLVARGPSDLAKNVTGLLAKSFKQLDDIRVDCPDEPTPPNYPVDCTMTAIDTSKPGSRDLPDGEQHPVSGGVTVLGVYPKTMTYGLRYGFQRTSARK